MILIDLQKAFDTINHCILLKKMKFIGFSDEAILWFSSYLSARKFKVVINNSYSTPGDITCGVPQGSILGPLLFLLYINDISQSIECEVLLYADDTCLLFQHKDIMVIKDQLNKNFQSLFDWFLDNYFKANPDKSHFLINECQEITLNIKGENIANCLNQNNLGITFNNKFCFDNHVAYLCKKEN